jgi:hypothetical protein
MKMVDWEVTATTIYCEAVDDEVTLIVNGAGTAKCTGRQKYENPLKDVRKTLAAKSRSLGRKLSCYGEQCAIVKQYRVKVAGE